MTELYSIKDVAQIFAVQESRLRYWAQTGFVNPSVRKGGRMHYTFQDLISVRAAKELLDAGLGMPQVRQNLESIRGLLPELVQPGSRMHLCSDGVMIVAVDHGEVFQPESGQVVMDFTLDGLAGQIAESLARPTTEAPGPEIPAEPGTVIEAPGPGLSAEPGTVIEAPGPGVSAEPGTVIEVSGPGVSAEPGTVIEASGPGVSTEPGTDPAQEPARMQETTGLSTAQAQETTALSLSRAALAGSAPMRTLAARGRAAGPVLSYEHDDEDLADSVIDDVNAGIDVAGADGAMLASAVPRAMEDEPTQSHAPASAYRAFLQGCEAEDRGDLITAEMAYRRALALQPTLAAAHTNLGNLLYRRGDTTSARLAYERALEFEPNQPEARYNLGNVLEDIGETELAIAELRRVCWMHPDFADAHYNLGLMLARVGGTVQAQEHLERYIQLDDGSEWAERARSFLQAIA